MRFRSIAAVLVTSLVLAACGSESSPASTDAPSSGTAAPATTVAATGAPAATSAPPNGEAPTPTISPDLPDEFLAGVGPVAVVGDALDEFPDGDGDPAVGSAAPVLVAETLDGEAIRIDGRELGRTWIVFLAHWCPHCNDEIPVINELRDDGRVPDDVTVVAVSTAASPERPNWPPATWLDDKDWTYPAVLDGVDVDAGTFIAADVFGLTAFPFSVLVDDDGSVAARWSGGRSADELEDLLTTSWS